jgi:hypothetical protein
MLDEVHQLIAKLEQEIGEGCIVILSCEEGQIRIHIFWPDGDTIIFRCMRQETNCTPEEDAESERDFIRMLIDKARTERAKQQTPPVQCPHRLKARGYIQ